MNTFNLTFWGEILAGKDPQKVKTRFAKMFAIEDPVRLEHFFSGDTIILRRNLERKVAAEYYSKLRKLGVEVKLVKVDPVAILAEEQRATPPPPAADEKPENENKESQWQQARRLAEIESQRRKRTGPSKPAPSAEQTKARAAADAAAAKRKAEKAAEQAHREQQAAQRKAEREEARLKAEAVAAQRRAEQEALKQQQAEAEARHKKQEKKQQREQVKAEAKRKAEQEALRRQQAREAAQRKAARDEAKRLAAQEAARRKAEAAQQKRIAKEQAAAEKARIAEEKRKAAEKAAVQRALEAEQRRQEELQRQEQAATEKAAREAKALRLREEQEAALREEKAQREAERARIAQEREKQRAERERKQAKEKRRLEEERRQEEEREREQAAQRKLMEEQAITRGAEELSDMAALKPVQARVKSSLDLPRRNAASAPSKVKRQAGAPNFYRMHAFRNTSDVRERAAAASKSKRSGVFAAALALAALLVLTGRYLGLEHEVAITGPSAVAAAPAGSLMLQAGETLLFHDRSGVGTESIRPADRGIQAAKPPFAYDPSGELLLHTEAASQAGESALLQKCATDLTRCAELFTGGPAEAMAIHPLTGQVFLHVGPELIKLSPGGEVLARAALPTAQNPVLRLESGLLFTNSADGPAISVFRYEDSAFGKQLDEVLLLPPPALDKGQERVRDFVRAGDYWWVSLHNPGNGSAGLYLFDNNWKYLQEITLDEQWQQARLENWGQKILLWRPDAALLKRFAASGNAEADLVSTPLAALIEQQQKSRQLKDAGWAATFSLLIVIAAVGAALGYHQYLRSLVYRSRPTRGAEPIDESTENIRWVDPANDLAARIKRLWLSYGALVLALILLSVGLGASVSQLAAVLVALCGPAAALALFSRSEPAHVGTLEEQLILVDHRDMYHMASGSRIQYRGPFLLIDDVVVFTGGNTLPALSREQVEAQVKPVAQTGMRVDRKTVIVKLLETHHPLARGATYIAIALLAATVVLAAGQLL